MLNASCVCSFLTAVKRHGPGNWVQMLEDPTVNSRVRVHICYHVDSW